MEKSLERANMKLLEKFYGEVLNKFYNNGENRKKLEDFIEQNRPLNGAIVITKMTNSIREFIKYLGEDFGDDEYVFKYCPIDDIDSPANDKTIQIYKSLTDKKKNDHYLVLLEHPCIENPATCKQKLLLSRGLNIKKAL